MKSVRASSILSLLAITITAGPFAVAQDSGWYAGASVGASKAKIEDSTVTTGILGGTDTTTGIVNHDRDTGYKIFGGYEFNRFIGIEGGFFDLGKFRYSTSNVPGGTLNGTTKIRGVNIDLVGFLPITEKFSALGRFGLTQAETRAAFSATGTATVPNPNPSKRDMNYKYGIGLQYDFSKAVAMRAEAERFRVNDAVAHKGNIDFISAGLVVRFGRNTPAPAPIAAAEPVEPVAPPPAPAVLAAPVMVVVPVPVKTQQYCTILDIQFEINADSIQREEKEKLAVLGTFMTKYPDTTAEIEGHTDNVGTSTRNMELSQRRAESVVQYLVETLHIAPSRLTAVGYGDTRPLADNGTEAGKRQNRRIDAVIACVTDVEGLTVAPARFTMAMVIEFDRNKADIKPQYAEDLRKAANFLKANPGVTATVEGHTGNLQTTPQQAMEISQRRAQNVVDYLVDTLGVERSRLSVQGFGQTRRFAYNTSAEGQQENRRVNFILNYPK